MNKNNAKEFLPLVQALSEGKVIQVSTSRQGWCDEENLCFDLDIKRYRIKPTPPKEYYIYSCPVHTEDRYSPVVRSVELVPFVCCSKLKREHLREVIDP